MDGADAPVIQDMDFVKPTPKSPFKPIDTRNVPDKIILPTSEGSTAPELLSSEANNTPDDPNISAVVVTQETDPRKPVNLNDTPDLSTNMMSTSEGSPILEPFSDEAHGISQEELPQCDSITERATPSPSHSPKSEPTTLSLSVDMELVTETDLGPVNVENRETDQSGLACDAPDTNSRPGIYLNVEAQRRAPDSIYRRPALS